MSLTMGNLTNCFAKAMEENARYIGVLKKIPGQELEELIVTRTGNFISKLNYYLERYDSNLDHKTFQGAKIVAFTQADSAAEIEERLFN